MKHEPHIQQRAAQPYVGIRMPVTMEGLAEAVDIFSSEFGLNPVILPLLPRLTPYTF